VTPRSEPAALLAAPVRGETTAVAGRRSRR
jgi:hypothetical protein